MTTDQTSPDPKRQKTEMRIGTHSGTFHADEALAVFMLKLLPKYKDSAVIRSRTPDVLEACDIIVDVQGQYDGVKHFDHHQREFSETFSPAFKTKLSSAGLIYKHFGKKIISFQLDMNHDDSRLDVLYDKIYAAMIEAIDGNDNGQSAYPDDVEPAYSTSSITLPGMVAALNPAWNEASDDAYLDAQFDKASKLMGDVFVDLVKYYGRAWLPARDLVKAAIEQRYQFDQAGRIVVFDQFVTWKTHLFELEDELDFKGQIMYVIYSDGKGWRVQAVPVDPNSFKSRKPLPEPWRGVRDQALSDLTGIDGGVFVHASGFIGGNQTRDGALLMAQKALTL
ncbi:metal-dependent protein hydrolase [Lipomyces tetrasporus]|uniref:Metal-dependent protein hydrolase n=1 Tax=Lipomyces tetrasporus TaxID=54092 RepID=A0AAD7QVK3_9ASCO|nr:metal-dependent protein hydrolase [Lipomyces tetrasporus]KAJ8102120.1 metal-dependent protein hydrolase [Lipomyces tetrasporus]